MFYDWLSDLTDRFRIFCSASEHDEKNTNYNTLFFKYFRQISFRKYNSKILRSFVLHDDTFVTNRSTHAAQKPNVSSLPQPSTKLRCSNVSSKARIPGSIEKAMNRCAVNRSLGGRVLTTVRTRFLTRERAKEKREEDRVGSINRQEGRRNVVVVVVVVGKRERKKEGVRGPLSEATVRTR